MSITSSCTVLIVDRRPSCLSESAHSLLTLPLAESSILGHLLSRLGNPLAHCTVTIFAPFAIQQDYRDAVARVSDRISIFEWEALCDFLDELELSDGVLVLDPSRLPVGDIELDSLLEKALGRRFVSHFVPPVSMPGHSPERVQLDKQNRVRRIERLYHGVTHMKTAGVFASYMTVSSLRLVSDPERIVPASLREELTLHGVPSRDVALPCPAYDLNDETHLLALNKQLMSEMEMDSSDGGLRYGAGVSVDPTARLYGPVVLGSGCRIGAGAILIGPAVIGRGACVGDHSAIQNVIIDEDAHVVPGATIVDRVVVKGAGANRHGRAGTALPPMAIAASSFGTAESNSGPGDRPGESGRSFRTQEGIKRIADVVLSAVGLAVVSPLLIVTALLIKLTSRGPIFFAHVREGLEGREFRCWKFRTMCDRAHLKQRELYKQSQVDGPQFKMKRDPRTTPLGRVLRALNIDELPQLYNVLIGQMSLIGPRPSPFRENQICIPWRKARLSVKPGITGLWQVCRHERSSGDFHQWIHYDMMYVRHWTLGLDLRVLIATVLTLGGRFAAPAHWLVWRRNRPGKVPSSVSVVAAPKPRQDRSNEWRELCILPRGNDALPPVQFLARPTR